jgi:glycine cleavage system aminomethyltransferase T
MINRSGTCVVAHYGSAAGELSVCVRAVGLADRSELGKLLVAGAARGVAEFVRRTMGTALAPEGVSFSGGAWWCMALDHQVIVICESPTRARLLDFLRAQARRVPGVVVADGSAALAAIAVVGCAALPILSALGALGESDDVRTAAPFGLATIADAEVHVLLQSDRRALLLVDAVLAARVWSAVRETGRRYGLSLVGAEAVQRFALLERSGNTVPVSIV